MKTKERTISELIPAEYNPRQLSDKQHEDLKASLTRFGAVDPAIVNIHPDRKDIIVGGHQRLKVAKSLGWETFPCVEVNLTRDQERELNIRLNKNTGAWDWDSLSTFFEVEELTDWGFADEELFGVFDQEENIDINNNQEQYETYLQNEIRQIYLYYDRDTYAEVLESLKQIGEKYGVENDNSAVVLKLIELYGNN